MKHADHSVGGLPACPESPIYSLTHYKCLLAQDSKNRKFQEIVYDFSFEGILEF